MRHSFAVVPSCALVVGLIAAVMSGFAWQGVAVSAPTQDGARPIKTTDDRIEAGERIAVTIAGSSAGGTLTSVRRIGPSGKFPLLRLEPVLISGISPQEAEIKIADACRAAGIFKDGAVFVTRPDSGESVTFGNAAP